MREVFRQFAEQARRQGEKPAISDDRGLLSVAALASRVATLAVALPEHAHTIAVAGAPGVSWVVADLAATLMGRRVVPVPGFFSPAQINHLLEDAGVQLLLCCDTPPAVAPTGWPTLQVDGHATPALQCALPDYAGGADRVIYTSGTTGTPKGVVHGDRQMEYVIGALAQAVAASRADRHLSVLPPSLLLEQIAGVFIPLLVGARVHIPGTAIGAMFRGDPRGLSVEFSRFMPSTTVLVPQLLTALTELACSGSWVPPASLRFAAVGGAPVPLSLVCRARASGIPAIRGYGLSECGSVVAMERPGSGEDLREGCCGLPLPGLEVSVVGGEVLVKGPSVMHGYLGRPPVDDACWHTGDTGHLEPDGALMVQGRLDRVIVLPSGRNVSADWVEARVLADTRFNRAQLSLSPDGELELVATAGAPADNTQCNDALIHAMHTRINGLLADLPDYARPGHIRLTQDAGAAR